MFGKKNALSPSIVRRTINLDEAPQVVSAVVADVEAAAPAAEVAMAAGAAHVLAEHRRAT